MGYKPRHQQEYADKFGDLQQKLIKARTELNALKEESDEGGGEWATYYSDTYLTKEDRDLAFAQAEQGLKTVEFNLRILREYYEAHPDKYSKDMNFD